MPRTSVVCAGGCGKPLHAGRGSLPEGQRKCRCCRRQDRAERPRWRTGPERACPVCGTGFIAYKSTLQTCSLKCGQRYRLATHGPATPRKCCQCEVCGSDYKRSYSGQRTCGRACGVALKARHRPPAVPGQAATKTCAACGTAFSGSRSRYCSAECAARATRAKNLARYGKSIEVADRCEGCGGAVAFRRKRCDDCKARTACEAKRRKRRAERARRRGVVHERYTLAEIAARDRHRCQLCGKRVPMTLVVPHPKAPTIDHVLPIAAGGQDTRANVQLAHFDCNWKKSDGGTQQLALVG